MTRDLTDAGAALLEREAYNSRSFTLITEDALCAIEQEAAARALDEVLSVENVARALHRSEVDCWPDVDGCQTATNHDGTALRLIAALRGDR